MDEYNKRYQDPKEVKRCKDLIISNGGQFTYEEFLDDELYFEAYDLNEYGITFSPQDNSITFIDEQGDFAEISVNYYELLGFLLHWSFIGIGFKRVEKEGVLF